MFNIPIPVFDLVLFGATGDVSFRKILPALCRRQHDNPLPAGTRIIGVGRAELTADEFRAQVRDACLRAGTDEATADAFGPLLDYVRVDLTQADAYRALAANLADYPDRVRVYYLATAPELFTTVAQNLAAAGLATPAARLVLEKPLGHDLASSRAITEAVGAVFEENSIFRIDHYLGKEAVQNLMVLRFANPIFENSWSAAHIDHVQITVSETVGLEGRAGYYDNSGALRDMVQNHLLQLLCLVTMEPPIAYDPQSVRDEKLKVLRALKPIVGPGVDEAVVSGQYVAGSIAGQPVPGYADELGGRVSRTETFVALKAEISSWRWAGVPFYLRTGKRLAQRYSEIVIFFRPVPHNIFRNAFGEPTQNRLIIRLQPDDGIRLWMTSKRPTPGQFSLVETPLNLTYADTFGGVHVSDAYERLILDAARGNPTLFMRRDEVDAAWQWVQPIIDWWRERGNVPRPYVAGTWGPPGIHSLIERDRRIWHDGDQ